MMLLEDVVNKVVIIDDKQNEIIKLQETLEKKGFWTIWHNPTEKNDENHKKINNADMIFLDLWINESDANLDGQISQIRKILKMSKGFGSNPYGVVLWTKHDDEISKFKEKIAEDAKHYDLPLFITNLDKSAYLKKNNYDVLIDDLNTVLQKNTTSEFLIEWNVLVQKGKNESIKSIYSLVDGYDEEKEINLRHVLQKLALGYSGISDDDVKNCNIKQEARKAFCEFLNYEILHNTSIDTDLTMFEDCTCSLNEPDKMKIYGKINKVLLLDSKNIDQRVVIPGNIYEIVDSSCIYRIKEGMKNNNNVEKEKYILIEVTPPCDYANGKNKTGRRRVVGGLILKNEAVNDGKPKDPYKRNHFTNVYPLVLEDDDEPKMIIFDFMYFGTIEEDQLKDETKYKIIYRAKNRYFSDILNTMAANMSRIGNVIIK